MNPILYIETNLRIGAAKGQAWHDLFRAFQEPIQVAIPSICVMEAMSVIEAETRARDEFQRLVEERHLREVHRDLMNHPVAQDWIRSLEQVITDSQKYLNSIRFRLKTVLDLVTRHGEWLPCSAGTIANYCSDDSSVRFQDQDFPLSPTDPFILSMVLDDAAGRPGVPKAFLSADRHFTADEVQNELNRATIRPFKNMTSALGWLTHPPSA